jgi:hypothetical protein
LQVARVRRRTKPPAETSRRACLGLIVPTGSEVRYGGEPLRYTSAARHVGDGGYSQAFPIVFAAEVDRRCEAVTA